MNQEQKEKEEKETSQTMHIETGYEKYSRSLGADEQADWFARTKPKNK